MWFRFRFVSGLHICTVFKSSHSSGVMWTVSERPVCRLRCFTAFPSSLTSLHHPSPQQKALGAFTTASHSFWMYCIRWCLHQHILVTFLQIGLKCLTWEFSVFEQLSGAYMNIKIVFPCCYVQCYNINIRLNTCHVLFHRCFYPVVFILSPCHSCYDGVSQCNL